MLLCMRWLSFFVVSVVFASIIEYIDDDDHPLNKRVFGGGGVCKLPQRLAAATFSTAIAQVPKLMALAPSLMAKRDFFETDENPIYNQLWTLAFKSVEAMVNSSKFQSIISDSHNFFVELGDGSTVTADYETMERTASGGDVFGLDVVNVTLVTSETLLYPLLDCYMGNRHAKLAKLSYGANLDSSGSATGKFLVGLPKIPGVCNLLLSFHLEHAVGLKLAVLSSIGGNHQCDLGGGDEATVTRLFAEKHRYTISYNQRRLAYSRRLDKWRLGRWKLNSETLFADDDHQTATIHCVTTNLDGWANDVYFGDICQPEPITLTNETTE